MNTLLDQEHPQALDTRSFKLYAIFFSVILNFFYPRIESKFNPIFPLQEKEIQKVHNTCPVQEGKECAQRMALHRDQTLCEGQRE